MATPGFLHASPPIEPGGAISTTSCESAEDNSNCPGYNIYNSAGHQEILAAAMRGRAERSKILIDVASRMLPGTFEGEMKKLWYDVEERYQNMHIVLKNEKEDIIAFPIYHRFDERAQRKLLWRFNQIKISGRQAIFLTLGCDIKNWKSPMEAAKAIKKAWGNMRKYFNIKDYVCVIEFFKKTHYPHLHVLILDRTWIAHREEIADKWEEYGFGRQLRVPRIENGDAGLRYTIKYLRKPLPVYEKAMLFFGNIRQYSTSHGMLECPESSGGLWHHLVEDKITFYRSERKHNYPWLMEVGSSEYNCIESTLGDDPPDEKNAIALSAKIEWERTKTFPLMCEIGYFSDPLDAERYWRWLNSP